MQFSSFRPKYTTYKYENQLLVNVGAGESYQKVRLPFYNGGSNTPKVLFVLDYMPTEDLRSSRLLSGETGALLFSLLDYTLNRELKEDLEFSWMACTFNACRTAGKPKEFQYMAKSVFAERVRDLISKYKPDVVVAFGADAIRALVPKYVEKSGGKLSPWYGVPLNSVEGSHKYKVVPSISLDRLVEGTSAAAGLLGYVIQHLANAITAKLRFSVDSRVLMESRIKLITNVFDFKRVLTKIQEAPVVAIDTETKNLNRVTNQLLTIQFAISPNLGYVLPINHKDTPFDPTELRYIKKRLRAYFEGDNDCDYHVYTNAVFDLNVVRMELGTRYMHNDVWDILAGEMCFDPETFVWTDKGPVKIRVIVEDPEYYKVLSYNLKTHTLEYQPVLFGTTRESTKRKVKFEYEGGSVIVTEDHPVWSVTRGMYVEVKDLEEGENVLVLEL